jgi:hypothetical protein
MFAISNFAQGLPYMDTDYFSIACSSVSKERQYWTKKYVGTTHWKTGRTEPVPSALIQKPKTALWLKVVRRYYNYVRLVSK